MNAVALQQEYPQQPVRSKRSTGRLVFPRQALQLHAQNEADRAAVESYIADRFAAFYGARISSFLPHLISAKSGGKISAAVGLQAAGGQKLFLEQYLAEPLEQVLSEASGQRVKRNSIAEIGNLTVTQAGNSYLIFILVTAILDVAGFEWVSFTATSQVRRILGKLDCQAYRLCSAESEKLASGGEKWGTYYETQPEVLAVSIKQSMATIHRQRFTTALLEHYQDTIETLGKQLRDSRK